MMVQDRCEHDENRSKHSFFHLKRFRHISKLIKVFKTCMKLLFFSFFFWGGGGGYRELRLLMTNTTEYSLRVDLLCVPLFISLCLCPRYLYRTFLLLKCRPCFRHFMKEMYLIDNQNK